MPDMERSHSGFRTDTEIQGEIESIVVCRNDRILIPIGELKAKLYKFINHSKTWSRDVHTPIGFFISLLIPIITTTSMVFRNNILKWGFWIFFFCIFAWLVYVAWNINLRIYFNQQDYEFKDSVEEFVEHIVKTTARNQ